MSGKYDDIIDLPHHVSKKHPPMPMEDRAAQFSPFAALTGYGDAVKETARLTDKKLEMDEEKLTKLNTEFAILKDSLLLEPEVTVTYFVPDERKSGGRYVDINGKAKRIDEFDRLLILDDGRRIPLDDIISIESELFKEIRALCE